MSLPRVWVARDPRFGPEGWWRFESPADELCAPSLADVSTLLARVDAATRHDGSWAVGFVSYEAAPAFEPKARVLPPKPGVPLAWFGLFPPPTAAAAPDWDPDFRPPDLEPELGERDHGEAIAAIHAAIARGDSYQANFTYRLRAPFPGSGAALFGHLVRAQRSPYSLLLEHRDWSIASVSPELFFERSGNRVTCRPMKGTARRGRTLAEDRELAERLASSPKERAENLMIVDMVRNDLGRIARSGSVHTRQLFAVERFATVTQMTSEVSADSDASLPDLFRALFPCASITGAPKLSTLDLLARLERSPRGVYTGAAGFVAPGGDCRFSVAIRTAWLDHRREELEYGTGSGIVWDSRPGPELAEARIKAQVFAAADPPFELLETIRWEPGRGFVLLDRHLDRLEESAAYFLRPCDRTRAHEALAAALAGASAPLVVRLRLDERGRFAAGATPLGPQRRRWRVGFAPGPVDPGNRFLFHKTTRRDLYDRALAAVPGVDEVLLWNSNGELTEGTRTNLAVEIEGRLWTPPISCGLLPGCLRVEALARGRLSERVLYREDLVRARRVYVFNSVRGWLLADMTE